MVVTRGGKWRMKKGGSCRTREKRGGDTLRGKFSDLRHPEGGRVGPSQGGQENASGRARGKKKKKRLLGWWGEATSLEHEESNSS